MGARIGEMPCTNPKCNCQDMTVEVTAAGTWQSKCHKCGMPSFGKMGTKWRRDMEAMIVLDKDETTPAPAPAPVNMPITVPEPPKKKIVNSAFSLGDL